MVFLQDGQTFIFFYPMLTRTMECNLTNKRRSCVAAQKIFHNDYISFNISSSWMKKSLSARVQSLYSLAKGLEAKRRDIAASISAQTGVSMDEAEKETELSITRLSDWAAYCDKIKGGSLVCVFLNIYIIQRL